MSFLHLGSGITLRGTTLGSQVTQLSFGQLNRATSSDSVSMFFALSIQEQPENVSQVDKGIFPVIGNNTTSEQHKQLSSLLNSFRPVFEILQGLPPVRPFDHQIPLITDSASVNVKPYRYLRFQKTEIERLVKEMLDQGIIRPSNSPFSSPVLLVKKRMVHGAFVLIIEL